MKSYFYSPCNLAAVETNEDKVSFEAKSYLTSLFNSHLFCLSGCIDKRAKRIINPKWS
tara:strand:+ start:141 stop:314 length:174 start_codon:yes stop_codon:yes gene_type:complete